jgi:hypothetical protein
VQDVQPNSRGESSATQTWKEDVMTLVPCELKLLAGGAWTCATHAAAGGPNECVGLCPVALEHAERALQRVRKLEALVHHLAPWHPPDSAPVWMELVEKIDTAIARAVAEEAAKHADCCVDREDLARAVEGERERVIMQAVDLRHLPPDHFVHALRSYAGGHSEQ